ncbi:MAG TPA: TetR/AcrR family transcriptional regulator, partial [Solirubrobacterales bacterium]|nr:TetR/AcrR family transcriptional regulator [Solirubrobacterales bacterium]
MKGTAATGKRQYRMSVRAQRSEETAERIREVSLEHFLSRSYEDVTLNEVAEEAGVTVPTLIAHFGRKEDLFATAVEDWGNRMVESRDEAPVG